jgi:uncharacterized oxidoreductase
MKLQGKKALITGGGTGIGLAIAKAFTDNGASVILVGRRADKLAEAAAGLKGASYIQADIVNGEDVTRLVREVSLKHGGLDILVNNAGVANVVALDSETGVYENARYEMEINYLGTVRLIEVFLPLLKRSREAAIINIESVVSYAPSAVIGTYSATKAALHSYSQALRIVLQQSQPQIRVFEVFPPFVDTDLTKGFDAEKLSPADVAADVVYGVENEEYAIRNGKTKDLYALFRQSPEAALGALNPSQAAGAAI